MVSPDTVVPYLPVAVWGATGLSLLVAFRGSAPPVLLRLAAAFLALWALLATTTLLWIVEHGGWAAVGALLAQPSLLFAPEGERLWVVGGAVVLALLLAAFLVNQAVGHGLLRLLRPTPMPWPARLPPPPSPTFLGRFASDRPEAFSFTLLERAARGRRVRRREVILISDALLARLSPEEREATVAHELGHLVALDSRYLTYLRTSARMLRWDPFFALVAGRLTRREELRADRIAVRYTGRPEALARALEKAAAALPGAPAGLPAARGLLGRGARRDRQLLAERIRRLREEA